MTVAVGSHFKHLVLIQPWRGLLPCCCCTVQCGVCCSKRVHNCHIPILVGTRLSAIIPMQNEHCTTFTIVYCRWNHHQLHDIAFVKPKCSIVPGCTRTVMHQSSTMANVLPPTKEEQSAFFEQLKMAHPNSAILSLAECHKHVHQLRKLDVFHLHSPLSMIINTVQGVEQNSALQCLSICYYH